ncbi:DNA-directed RNA polymerase delta subunit [Streptococcus pneumoniae GA40028]|nr:putative DNA-directed RNA polymerase subunit delta [Streptococcus pneumoniae GA41277]EHZ40440.1 DNA-directed RNA polymerase delta subunit [Streptococcus pneumoniae GA40028]EHZ74815.1 DNA-directed RNA polymerase delta subunit [Streptococcus pneumoniae GA47794]
MELEVFAGQEKSELSMIEVARAILELRGRDHEMHFSDLVNEIQNYLGTSNSDIREALPLFYTELNFDGSFISLGDNKWGLRSWYGVDEIDEEIIALEENDDDEVAPKAKKKRVNAFMDGDSDAIDYNADDPEDEDAYEADPALSYDDENPDDEKMKWKLMMQKSTKSLQMTWEKMWISTKTTTSFQMTTLKPARNKS